MSHADNNKSFNRFADVRVALNDRFVAEENPFLLAINDEKRIEAFVKMEENIQSAAAELSEIAKVPNTAMAQPVNKSVVLHAIFNQSRDPVIVEKDMNAAYMEVLGQTLKGLRALEQQNPTATPEESMQDLSALLLVTRAIIRTCENLKRHSPALAVA